MIKDKWRVAIEAIQSLQFCGCGEPEFGYAALLESLQAHNGFDDDGAKRTAWANKLNGRFNNNSGYDYLILYFMDAAGLLEHGGSVGGSWLSDKGKAILEFLEEWGTEDIPELSDL